MNIKKGENSFYLEDDKLIGEITYYEDENHYLIVDHTFVDPEHRGKQYAQLLVDRMVEHARSENKLIIPVCPYVLKLFKSNPKYHDVWFQDHDYHETCKL